MKVNEFRINKINIITNIRLNSIPMLLREIVSVLVRMIEKYQRLVNKPLFSVQSASGCSHRVARIGFGDDSTESSSARCGRCEGW